MSRRRIVYPFVSSLRRLLEEYRQWPLWIPVILGIGILCYFSVPVEPPHWVGYGWMGLGGICSLLLWRRGGITALWVGLLILLSGLGFTATQWRTHTLATPRLEKRLSYADIVGEVLSATLRRQDASLYTRLLIHPHHIEGFTSPSEPSSPLLPHRIRVDVRTDDGGARPGDRVSFRATLVPPADPVLPGAYDFAQRAYFKQIGATGYAVSDVAILPASTAHTSLDRLIARWRGEISQHFLDTLGREEGSIASALLVGERGAIRYEVLETVRTAGIAHLLAISGLHMVLVTGLVFLFIRQVLVLIPWAALRLPLKEWGAVGALLTGAVYLVFTGMPVSAQRAFLMVAMALVALCIGRAVTPMRCVAVAATVVLLVAPEQLLSPGFQMSFAAATSLIACFELLVRHRRTRAMEDYTDILEQQARDVTVTAEERERVRKRAEKQAYYRDTAMGRTTSKCMRYLGDLWLSSLVAGAATGIYALYHFNHQAVYGLLTNMLAIPLTSMWIMPSGLLAMFLWPLGLETMPLQLMGSGIGWLLEIAQWVASLPVAALYVPTVPVTTLGCITLGGLWLCLWQQRWRLWGLAPILLGLALIGTNQSPDMILDREGKMFAVQDAEGMLHVSGGRPGSYVHMIWARHAGQSELPPLPEYLTDDFVEIGCDPAGCLYHRHGQRVVIARQAQALVEECAQADVLVNLTTLRAPCDAPHHIITRHDLRKDGAHALWLAPDHIHIEHVRGHRGQRPWVP